MNGRASIGLHPFSIKRLPIRTSPGVYPRVPVEAGSPLRSDRRGAGSELIEGVEMTG